MQDVNRDHVIEPGRDGLQDVTVGDVVDALEGRPELLDTLTARLHEIVAPVRISAK